jgi:hypothetical protein
VATVVLERRDEKTPLRIVDIERVDPLSAGGGVAGPTLPESFETSVASHFIQRLLPARHHHHAAWGRLASTIDLWRFAEFDQ